MWVRVLKNTHTHKQIHTHTHTAGVPGIAGGHCCALEVDDVTTRVVGGRGEESRTRGEQESRSRGEQEERRAGGEESRKRGEIGRAHV